MAVFKNVRRAIARGIDAAFNPRGVSNPYYDAFLNYLGAGYTRYDQDAATYLEEGYGNNPDVYAVIQQMATKTVSIPFYIKKVKDERSKSKLDRLKLATKQVFNPQQYVKKTLLETKAFEDQELPFPMEKPNEIQTWNEIFALYKTYLRTTGNVFFYMLAPEEGANKGVPQQMFVLPSHMVQIVVNKDHDFTGIESPISHYVLTEGNQFVEFEAENVIHVKLSNPFFDMQGGHLYGLSPLKAALGNIQSSNEAISNNIKTMQNGGAFGLLHGKNHVMNEAQAKELKSRLKEMDASPERLSKIAGVSMEVGFTRISLTTDELKPFEYLKHDQKTICNVLGWSDKLLNNDAGSQYGGTISEFRKQVVTDNIMPDLQLLEQAFENHFLPRFKGYENAVIDWDYSELPEMQEDLKELSKWLNDALDRGVIARDEYRGAIKYPLLETPEMQAHTVSLNVQLLEDALMPMEEVGELTLDE